LLTGANNSGKSSVLKAILMLRDSIKHYDEVFDLDLTGKEHFSGNMQNVLHNPKTPDLTISIAFPFLSCNSVALLLKFSSNSRFDKFQTFSSKFY
jgi:predicted ATPase